jgi:hypothetical protein
MLTSFGERREVFMVFRKTGDVGGIKIAISRLCDVAYFLGKYQEALSLARECMRVSQESTSYRSFSGFEFFVSIVVCCWRIWGS